MTAAFQVETPSLPAALAPMMTERRWLVWRWEPSPTTGKPTKVPYRADAPDRKAASDNPATWGSFASAARAVAEGKADGIGYALMGSEIGAFDLDDCRDAKTGRIDRWALDLIERAGSYVEVTISGSGLRILGRAAGDHVHRAQAVPNSNGARLETYRQAKRYIVVTGNVIEEASAELADLDILIDETVADLDAAAKAEKDRQRAERSRQREVERQRSRPSDDWYEPQAGNLHPQLERIIRYGAPIGERSDEFHHVVGWLKGNGYSPSQIETLLSAYPDGIAEKFFGRLRQEIDRCYDKTDGPRERARSGERQGGARHAEPPQPIELHWHGEADPNADRAWLIRHLVFETGKGLVAGQWGAGKTFGVLDMSGSVMTGEPFAGRKVMRTGGVLFIAPEGAFEIPVRLRGVVEGKLRGASMARAAVGGPPIDPDNLPFVWIEECPPLTKAGSLDRLIVTAKTAAAEMDRRFGVPIVLVVIDTVAAGAGFEDENSASETQKVMDAMGALSRETGAFVLGVDHFGKVSETGTRGSSAKEAAADVVLAMLATRSEAGEISNTRMAVRKVRGARSGYEIPYSLEVVTLGVDQDDEPVTTCIVAWQTQAELAPQPTKPKERWPQSLRVFRIALSAVLVDGGKDAWPFGNEGPKVLAARVGALRDEFCRAYPVSGETAEKQADAKRKGFARALKAAMDRGLVATREIGGVDHVWLVADGQE